MVTRVAGFSLMVVAVVVAVWFGFLPRPLLANGADVGVTAILSPTSNGRAGTALALTAAETVAVRVDNFGSIPQSNIPIFYKLNGQTIVSTTITGPITAGASLVYTFTVGADLAAVGSYQLAAGTALPGDMVSGNDSLTATVKQLANPAVLLPFHEGFENSGPIVLTATTVGLTGAEMVDFANTDPHGRLRTQAGPGFYHTGTHAATLDRAAWNGDQINFLTLTLNLSNYDVASQAVVLDFSFMHHDEEHQANDRVWVRGSDSDPWLEIVNLNELQGPAGLYNQVSGVHISNLLAAGGQNFSSSFQLRFGQEDNFPASSLLADDGFTFDDIVLRELPEIDAGAGGLLLPSRGACGDSSQPVRVSVANYGRNPLAQIPVTVAVSGGASANLSGQAAGPIDYQETAPADLGTIDTYAGGTFTFTISTAQAGDTASGNDTVTVPLAINPIPIATIAPEAVCHGQSTTLRVMPEPGVSYLWYTSAGGGEPVAAGASWTTPALLAPTTYYLEREVLPATQVGETEDPTATGSGIASAGLDNGLVFDVHSPAILDAVHVYPDAAGQVTVRLLDANNQLLDRRTITVTTPGLKTPLPLGFNLPVGSGYRLDAVGSADVGIYRSFRLNTPYPYPYRSPLLEIVRPIKGSMSSAQYFYYFFYDWQVSSAVCTGPRTPVEIAIMPTNVHTTVTSSADSGPGSLRHALENICDNSTIDFAPDLADQTITLTAGPLSVSRLITITNPLAPNLTISGNHSSTIFHVQSSGQLSLDNLTLAHGAATDQHGGAIYNDGGRVNISQATLSDNAAPSYGGGIYNANTGTVNILQTALLHNQAAAGGAIYNLSGLVNVGNSTLSGNAALADGGAIYQNQGALNLSQVTVYANTADQDGLNGGNGGGLFNQNGMTTVAGSIVAGNVDGGADEVQPDLSGDFYSQGYNVVGNHQGVGSGGTGFFDGVNGDQVGNTVDPLDPGLNPLSGWPAYHSLQPDSPARNAGNPAGCRYLSHGDNPLFAAEQLIGVDQRGLPRPQETACDVGAIETQSIQLAVLKTAQLTDSLPWHGVITYSLALTNHSVLVAAGTVLTDTLPDNLAFAAWLNQPAGAQVVANQLLWTGAVEANQTLIFTYLASHTGQYGEVFTNVVEVWHPVGGRSSSSVRVGVEAAQPSFDHQLYLPIIRR